MALDITGLGFFMPIFGFLFVFTIVYALLAKTKLLGDSMYINLIIGFIVAIVFSLMSSAQTYVEMVTPWFAILIIAIFFILLLVGMSQRKVDDIMKPGFVWVFIIILILVFLVAATKVFSNSIESAFGDIERIITTESRVAGGIILLIVAGAAAWVISKK